LSLYKTKALVLRSRKYREADCLLTLLTQKKGKISAIAKGVRKAKSRLRGGVQLFTHNEMLLSEGRNLDVVTQSECLEAFTTVGNDMEAMAAACYWCELLDSFIPMEQNDAELYTLALAGFHLLALEHHELIIRALEIKLLSLLGFMPNMDCCVSCGRSLLEEQKVFFSVGGGGVVCSCCKKEDTVFFTPETLKVWRQIQRMNLSMLKRLKVSREGLKILDDVLERFIIYQLDYPLKSRRVLKEIWANNTFFNKNRVE
jgi:DNA repair protein RecO (recombination protein O)